jgi:hypothetical protein
MNSDERELLEEFRTYLKEKAHKECVDAYLNRPLSSSISQQALRSLAKAIDAIEKA